MTTERKCENCVFCTPTPENMSFLPNDFICGSYRSKWHGYWPVNGCCECFTKPTGKTIGEVFENDENTRNMFEGMISMVSGAWNKDSKQMIEEFIKQDAAILEDFGMEGK